MKNPLRHRWILSITFLTILALSGCRQTPRESTNPPSPVATTTASPGKVTTGAAPTPGTLTAQAQKLGVKPQGATTCPNNAPIKGNVTKKRGNIYHVPNSLDYQKVKPDICFADVATAEKAGFRAPK
ncbi:hypothetical protein BZZ01_17680 [Nostocales cyanobacterium HT-58-2]|nr:hypothetical protein BZZ01_17680 [Nostocales cyanobacterium HT-58-2]